jgi:alpha-glucosidase
VIDDAIAGAASVGAPATWVLSNHDVPRTVTRYSRSQPAGLVESEWERSRWDDEVPNHILGRRRARACALLQLALPGTAYIYQGEELGLEEVENLPDEVRQDPTWEQSGFTDVGRDGCRVPLPWTNGPAPYGFSPPGSTSETWLPQPSHWGDISVEVQEQDPESSLHLYRAALDARDQLWAPSDQVRWLDVGPDVLAFARGDGQCWVNTGAADVDLPEDRRVVLASLPGVRGLLPPDTAVWLAG